MSKARELAELGDSVTVDSGNVGIGTSSPSYKLHVDADTNSVFRAGTTGGGALNVTVDDYTIAAPTWRIQSGASEPISFAISTSEAARIDSSGNLLVGKTSVGLANSGVELREGAASGFTRDNVVMDLNRTSTDGQIMRFRKDGTTVGSISTINADNFRFVSDYGNATIGAGDTGIIMSAAESVRPFNPSTNTSRDNAIGFGESYARWVDIYATNGTIQTSDANEKQDIEELNEAEARVAVVCKGLLRKFRWKDSVAEKGDDARIHFGIIAQDLQAAFAAEGLDAGEYAMFISTTWWELDGQTYDTAEEAPEGATERTRLGVRYPELLAFIISAI